ncbi:MAG: squalene/phytoene synthase family protein [Hyphomicrobium sp.]|nr:squalene/phytoene synthase family protein [Hyphomicrobium sp.]
MTEASTTAALDTVRQTARAGAPDRYMAALLSPPEHRAGLIALAAFAADIEKISSQVTEPQIGEIRIQWWRDAISADAARSGHPVADELFEAVRRYGLPRVRIDDFLDAHVHALYADAPADDAQLQLELDLREGVLFALAAHVLGERDLNPSHGLIHDAAQAYGLARLGLSLPYALSRGRVPLPPAYLSDAANPDWRRAIAEMSVRARDRLQHVSSAYRAQPAAVKTALLPLALVEPYLRALSAGAHDPARDVADIAPLTRVWRLAKTHVRGRL